MSIIFHVDGWIGWMDWMDGWIGWILDGFWMDFG
eukprot:CAMPEP_0172395028 /NCGR_PEP_ID=MMETSP1061-20121228/17585_1 /TAXON_ID=37318 /ORGANISM="Pseudo-nitzschia pungens, Strain cf. pungens" /LENGTH=33 /DNA_ID= /DNA_START= /DNA_END= /DNA_ORIENTATION=